MLVIKDKVISHQKLKKYSLDIDNEHFEHKSNVLEGKWKPTPSSPATPVRHFLPVGSRAEQAATFLLCLY